MKNIVCENCGKDSGVEAAESFGKNAARALRCGFIPKNLCLYIGVNETFIACSPDCCKILQEKIFEQYGVSTEKKQEVRKAISEMKATRV